MDGIGKMYNPDAENDRDKSRSGGRTQYSNWGAASRQPPTRTGTQTLPGHTENFYKALREASRANTEVQPSSAEKTDENAVPVSGGKALNSSAKRSSGIFDGLGNPLNGVASFLKKVGDDDILLSLMIILLFNENRQDDWVVLIILGILLLS